MPIKALISILLLFSVTQIMAAEPSVLLEPIVVESFAQNQLDAQIREDAEAIEKTMTVILTKVQEKSDRKMSEDWPRLQKSFEASALKLAQSKVWIMGFNKKFLSQYPELIVIDPTLRVIRTVALFPFLISAGYAAWIPLALAIPDTELIDAAYFSLRTWLKKRKFVSQYGVTPSDLDQMKKNLLARETLSQSEIEKMVNDPVFLKNLLNATSTKSDYQNVLSFWNDKTAFSNIDENVSTEIKMLIAIENLILRLELEGAFHDPGFSVRDLTDRSAIRQWISLIRTRRNLYKVAAQLKDFQYKYVHALLHLGATADIFSYEFNLFRDNGLTLLNSYKKGAEQLNSARTSKSLMCLKLFL